MVTQSVNGFELLTDGSLAGGTKERILGFVWVGRQQGVGSTVTVYSNAQKALEMMRDSLESDNEGQDMVG